MSDGIGGDGQLIENFNAYDPAPKDRYGHPDDDVIPREISTRPAEQLQTTHQKLWHLFMAEWERQRDNRREMAIDEGFYDHEQWTELEQELIAEIGHVPMTINLIATTINWLKGTERRGRTDFKILPRRKEGGAAAERKSHLLKYLSDVNRTEFAWSKAFDEMVKAGVGFMECGVQNDEEGEPIYERAESWRNCLWDSAAVEDDLSDARFFFRFRWTDVDTAVAAFLDPDDPDATRYIRDAAETTIDITSDMTDDPSESHENYLEGYDEGGGRIEIQDRRRVRMIEAWVRLPVMEKKLAGGDFRGEIYDPSSAGHVEDVAAGRARIVEKVINRIFVVIFTSQGIVWSSPSPYRHNQLPFTPLWANRRAGNHLPYGVILGLRDLQRDVNKRHAHALFLLVHQKIIMDQGAVADIDELEREINRPTAIIEKRPGYMLEINVDKQLVEHHLNMMMRSMALIQSVGGVTDENLGREKTAKSGKAILALQDQGALATAPLFDNLRFSRQVHGEKMLSLTEQFMTEKKQFRITNKRGTAQFHTINDGLPENDIIRTKADFIISEDAWQATLRQANMAMMAEVLQSIGQGTPEVVLMLLDLYVDGLDIPNREEMVKRIRKANGQEDPDADPNVPDPEREARNKQAAKEAEYNERMALAQLGKTEADADAAAAKAEKTRVEAEKIFMSLPGDSIGAKRAALELALMMLDAAPAAGITDAVLEESGYVSAAAGQEPMDAIPPGLPVDQIPEEQIPLQEPQPQPTATF